MAFTNSGLVDATRISPNRTINRNHVIDRITPHCYVGQATVEDMLSWLSNPSAQASANYVIGKDGRLGLNVEEKDRAWTSSSSENDNRAVTIECASGTSGDYAVNNVVYNKLIELCVDVCRRNGKSRLLWLGGKEQTLNYQPRADECLLSAHRWFAAKECPGQFLYSRYGQIADAVTAALSGMPMPTGDKYVVRLAFDQPKTQTNSFNNLDYAKAEADRYPGYSVYIAETGECVYTSPKETGYTPDEWIAMIAPIAQDLARINQILPSVVIAQTCVETGFGKTDLTRKFNIIGMKADLINSTWHSVWDGETYGKNSPEGNDGDKPYSLFRVYKSFRQCLEDYENFLLGVSNAKGKKYARIKGWTDPAKVINAIHIGTGTNERPEGYATDKDYEIKVMNMINRYNLTQYDNVMPGEGVERYAVQRSKTETQFRLGLFRVLDNAKNCADINWGYKVYDVLTDELVYEPQLTIVEKLLAKCLQFDQFVQWDNSNGDQWEYFNGKRSAPTFWQTRDEGLFITNCMGGVIFACKDIGIPASALRWYGKKGGIHFLTDHAKADAEKYFSFIPVKNVTVRQGINKGLILPGDILTYVNMSHTNIYFGVDMSFDAGHAYCIGSGEGAKYQRWIGTLAHPSAKVAMIVRLRQDTTKKYYRVQVGAYKTKASADKKAAYVKELTKYASYYAYEHNKNKSRDGYDCFVEQGADGKWRTYCGSFGDKANAEKRHDELEGKYKVDSWVVEA